jgi:DNA-binding protein Fis
MSDATHPWDLALLQPEPEPEPVPLAAIERRHILRIMRLVKGNKSRAARLLDIDRRTLYRKLSQYAAEG